MSIDMSQFLQTFFEESYEGLDIMENNLLAMDAGDSDDDVVNSIFRAAHSIKGGSATFGLVEMASFTHLMETLLDEMRDGRRRVSQDAVNLLLTSVDVLRDMLKTEQRGNEYDLRRSAEIKKELEVLLNSDDSSGSSGSQEAENKPQPLSTNDKWMITFKPDENLLQTGNDVVRIIRELADLGEINVKADYSRLPPFTEVNPELVYICWEIELYGDISRKSIEEIFEWVEGNCTLEISGFGSPGNADPVEQTGGLPERKDITPISEHKRQVVQNSESSSIRVGIDKVDAIINMVGELVITQSMLTQLGTEFDMSRIHSLQEGLQELERNTRELQETVMRIRMLPISFAFNRFPRLVHDMSQKLGKNIELKMSGEQTEIDKTVMEKIGDPLVHLVRNSLDHGIEAPEQRENNGKSKTGIVHLNAYHKGGNVVIEITDDGAGLNKEKILAKAAKQGLIDEVDNISDEKVYDLIFQPGFSTADQVSDISGRGVGMDVVKKNITALGGNVEVESREGQGTKFTIRLPLTLSILDGQLIRVGNHTYIIPLVSIIESLQAKSDYINAIAGKAELYRLREDYIPIVRLYQTFNLRSDTTDLTKGLLVVVEGDGQKAGIFVDDLLGQQQVVIKSLESNYRRVDGISGATILGDGTVALILDVPGLIRLTHDNPSGNILDPQNSNGRAA